MIPSIALKQVEVLRDGASAQYGSDAIAGVLNFTLKDAPSGGSVEVRAGTYQGGDIEGRGPDGQSITYAGNVGMPLGENGFANLSFEYGNSDPTDRSVQRGDASALIAAGNTAVRNPAQIWGSPEERNNAKFLRQLRQARGRIDPSLRPYQLRQPQGDRRLLLPQPEHPPLPCSAETEDRRC